MAIGKYEAQQKIQGIERALLNGEALDHETTNEVLRAAGTSIESIVHRVKSVGYMREWSARDLAKKFERQLVKPVPVEVTGPQAFQPPSLPPLSGSTKLMREVRARTLGASVIRSFGIAGWDESSQFRSGLAWQAADELAESSRLRFRRADLTEYMREVYREDYGQFPANVYDAAEHFVTRGGADLIFTPAAEAVIHDVFSKPVDTTLGWTSEAELPNFKPTARPTPFIAGSLEQLPRGGTATEVELAAFGETQQIKRYALSFKISDQDIADSTIDLILQLPKRIAEVLARARADLSYSLLLANPVMSDGERLFSAAHGNIGTAGSALSQSSLQAAAGAMLAQRADGVPLNLMPSYLITPPPLFDKAANFAKDKDVARLVSSGRGTLEPISEERINTAGVIDPNSGVHYAGSATNWFLAASATDSPNVEVAFRTGTGKRPTIRVTPLTEGEYGFRYDVTFDVGVRVLDWRGLYMATGEGS